ncbi:MAG: phage holin family protein [Thermoleophilia bacterium]|nr:phage holin family protein [Thermoleophilia bacterium]
MAEQADAAPDAAEQTTQEIPTSPVEGAPAPDEGGAVEGEAGGETDDERAELRARLGGLRRDAADLALHGTRLVVGTRKRELRRALLDIAGPLLVLVALLTAFGLANAAAVGALTEWWDPWLAALVMAAAWVVVAAVVALAVWRRGERGDGTRWWRLFTSPPGQTLEEVREARDDAARRVRDGAVDAAPALSKEAASAIVPVATGVATGMAGGVAGAAVGVAAGAAVGVAGSVAGAASGLAGTLADAASGVVGGGDDEAEDQAAEAAEAAPGGAEAVEEVVVVAEERTGDGLVRRAWGIALIPARVGLRTAGGIVRRLPAPPGRGRPAPPPDDPGGDDPAT